MSECNGASRGRCRAGASRSDKPNHVKRLNFGQSILELDVLEQPATSSKGTLLVLDQYVAGIPCTKKKDYVRRWIEAHEDEVKCDDLSQLSPILGASVSKTCEKSPVLGNKARRSSRKQIHVDKSTMTMMGNIDNTDHQEQSAGYSACCTVRHRLDYDGSRKNKNEREHLNDVQHTPPSIEKIVADGSPILGTRSYFRKRKRRKLQYDMEEDISPQRLILQNNKLAHAQADIIMDNDSDKVKEAVFLIEEEESPERSQSQIETQILGSKDGSLIDKRSPKIEIDTSCDSEDEDNTKLLSTNDSSNDSPSNIIEEIDTQDMLAAAETSRVSAKPLLLLKSPGLLQPTNASDETYCSEAEMMLGQNMHLSAKISQVPSGILSKEATQSKSTQTIVISTITTPSKTSLDKTMHARLLDSGKKRHKPKKGSMVAKLQSLINAEVSSIRIWRHRINKDATSTQFISVLVRHCAERFGNQFLHGILIEDRFNLLQNDVEIEEAESHDVQALPKGTAYRDITIILVCDIVGILKMISQVVIDVYPPWNIIDKVDLTIEPTYISINHNGKIADSTLRSRNNPRKREKRVLKEFNCPCMEEGRELPFCTRKSNVDKPDVIQVIFDS